ILGAVFFSLNVVAAMIMRVPPRDGPGSSHPGHAAAARPGEGRDFTLGQALRTRAYWMFYVGDSLSFSAYTMLVVHMVPFTTDMGIATTQATLTVALMGMGAVIGRITGGVLSDRFGWQVTMASFFFMQALAILNLLWVKDLWALYPLSLALGFFNAAGMINSSPALTRLFGLANLGKLLGVSATTGAVAGLLGATVAGILFDALKSYQWPFIYASVISALGATSIAIIKARHAERAPALSNASPGH
ncbi:MAG: MFS transporter, partial [Chloroflexota bacterium]|nr:MFS transporter [Chloroflexota bacterium]